MENGRALLRPIKSIGNLDRYMRQQETQVKVTFQSFGTEKSSRLCS